jgi:branched-chain amino acid transport system substrate-binding protein
MPKQHLIPIDCEMENQMIKIAALLAGVVLLVQADPVAAAPPDNIRLGLLTNLTGPLTVLGKEQVMGLELALKRLDNKIGGIPVELFTEDAGMTPDTALKATTRLTELNHIDFLIGLFLSNQLLAYVKPVTDTGTIIISATPGPIELAGKDCNPNLFVLSWQNNSPSEAVGKSMTAAGAKRAYFLSQNYVTGREHVAGAKQYFKGEVLGESYVPLSQVDYASEISSIRAANPDAVYVFLPGAGGISFVKQFVNAGLKNRIKLYGGSWLADEQSFPALGDAALGINVAAPWFAQLRNPQQDEFVRAFREQYKRQPVIYAAFVYDSIMLLDGAVRAVKGEIGDKSALRRAIETVPFQSTRGKFGFNANHFPIQNYYAAHVVKTDGVLQHELDGTVFEDHTDSAVAECHMKP